MTAIEPYQPAEVVLSSKDDPIDGWFQAFGNIVKLSEYICETDFVPDAMRRKPAAVASAILTGREMGIPPMTALRHIHVIKGKPGQSAELMRAQAMRAGHEIRYVESSDTRCVVEGRRREETEWTRVSFTVAQAKTAKIDLGGYPEDKLIARATSRLCRRKFPDAISGLPTVDELEDGFGEERPQPVQATSERAVEPHAAVTAAPSASTAQRKRQPRRATTTAAKAAASPAQQPAVDDSGEPDLPGDEPTPAPSAAKSEENEVSFNDEGEELCTRPQQQKLAILLDEEGIKDRKAKLDYLEESFKRPFASSKELTKNEASRLIDFLENARQQPSDPDQDPQ